MNKSVRSRSHTSEPGGFVLGRSAFAKISAVEGIHLSAAAERRLADFERRGLSHEERRAELVRLFSEKS